jgi:hypothetical protein
MSDYNYLPASDGTGDASLMHLTSGRANGATVYAVDSVVGVPSHFIATCGTLLSTGFIDPTTKVDFKGHVSGSTLIIDAFEPGSTDPVAGNASGQVIVIKPTTGWANRISNFIQNATGTGTPENHTVATLTATSVVTGALSVSGALTLNGAVQVTGTSWIAAQSIATAAAIAPTSQVYRVTALATAATINVPTYTAQDGMTGELRISDNGTGQTLSWATGWRAVGVTLPTSTSGFAFTYVSYEYSVSDGKYHVLGVARG